MENTLNSSGTDVHAAKKMRIREREEDLPPPPTGLQNPPMSYSAVVSGTFDAGANVQKASSSRTPTTSSAAIQALLTAPAQARADPAPQAPLLVQPSLCPDQTPSPVGPRPAPLLGQTTTLPSPTPSKTHDVVTIPSHTDIVIPDPTLTLPISTDLDCRAMEAEPIGEDGGISPASDGLLDATGPDLVVPSSVV
ncbi:hypothetical protein K2173_013034 [Erythroxylum novogranatense]|uniref:Uncharacterized protein n=1 Tax=Erythroxylum novogranatense TaxID=1862640 RepID=A0AAV8S6P2_9ROSI|nr:hypothetical protein K2173_013034 [Erythroxylum novogranatense]